jgi:hypothetical protein
MSLSNYYDSLKAVIQSNGMKSRNEQFVGSLEYGLSKALFPIILLLIFTFLYSYGAASLSYNYCVYTNNSGAILWSLLAFFFSGFYYPYYAFFLNPIGSISKVMTGGKRLR